MATSPDFPVAPLVASVWVFHEDALLMAGDFDLMSTRWHLYTDRVDAAFGVVREILCHVASNTILVIVLTAFDTSFDILVTENPIRLRGPAKEKQMSKTLE